MFIVFNKIYSRGGKFNFEPYKLTRQCILFGFREKKKIYVLYYTLEIINIHRFGIGINTTDIRPENEWMQ